MSLDTRDKSILTQVAFKGAVEVFADTDLTNETTQVDFVNVFSFLTDALFNGVQTALGPIPQRDATPAPTTVAAAIDNVAAAFPGATVETGTVSVKGEQHGPLPDWLFSAAAAKGVTEVYDNRKEATGTKRPWFRSTTDGDIAFWPPKGR